MEGIRTLPVIIGPIVFFRDAPIFGIAAAVAGNRDAGKGLGDDK